MKLALTDRGVLAVPAPASGRATVWDAKQAGLCLRVTPNAARTFFAVMRPPGGRNPSWVRVGSPPAMSVVDARKAARAALVGLAKAGPKPPPAPPAPPPPVLFAAVAEAFLERHVAGLRTATAYRRRVRKIVAEWGRRPITEISRRDIIQLLEDRVRTLGGNSARHLFSDLQALFNFALDRDLIEVSPCAGVRARRLHGPAPVRDRVLADGELAAVWAAAEVMGGDYAAVVKLLALTGCRRGEIGDLRWSEVNWQAERITIPAERMKVGRPHVLPLTPMLAAMLTAIPRRLYSDRVFAPLSWSRAGQKLHRRAGIEDWVLHDLRRTCRTGLSALGVADAVAERILAHEAGGIIKVYNRHGYESEMREALIAWEGRLMRIIGGEARAAAD